MNALFLLYTFFPLFAVVNAVLNLIPGNQALSFCFVVASVIA
uniref:Uncharacterized protein n=1 Tax=Siphoviridae sp. ctgmM3 TaxID=2827912 RepID=A0A8S5TJL4_9CAUD|nr:MAG TPA: hypothetical protein [Siphoviridae sp. ctgmM3]